MAQPLQQKKALVTGGSRGIGAAIVRRLARDGAAVAFTYISAKDKADALVAEVAKAGGRAVAIQADSGDAAAVSAAVGAAAQALGGLDILVNNAGVFVTGGVADEAADPRAFERQFAVNVTGVAAAVRAAAARMGAGGRIISIGSVIADSSPFAGMADYSASKAAVAAYARGWARDLGPRGITVNTVQPGPIDTDMNPDSGDFAEAVKKSTALGRYGRPEEVAAAVAFLASPEAGYITGAALTVDGGANA
jgi:3-oxoacyl-[acyl-carrier protein] reductase